MKKYDNINNKIREKIKKIRKIKDKNQKHGKELEDELIMSLSYLVRSVIIKYKRFDNYEDLYQEGMIGLMKAVQQYDTSTTFHFVRYAMWWIKSRIMRSIKKLTTLDNENMEQLAYLINNAETTSKIDPEKEAIKIENTNKLHVALGSLSEYEKKIISSRYELDHIQDEDMPRLPYKNGKQLEYQILIQLKNNIIEKE